MMNLHLKVNDRSVDIEVDERSLLVEVLRSRLGLTGTHVGCDTTQCGACTVHLDGKATKSCTVLAVQASGSSVRTIEAVAAGDELSVLQQAFQDHHALQCGYCTPGMIMMGLDILARHTDPTETDIRHDLEGNLCRCTGYHNIVTAILSAAKAEPA